VTLAPEANPEVVQDDLAAKAIAADKKPEGWTVKLGIGTTASWGYSSNVVGTPQDGATMQIGAILDGSAELVASQSEWLTTLRVIHTQSRTPVLPMFVKSADGADLISTYLYRLEQIRWIGPYARAKASTALFPSYVQLPSKFDIVKTDADGTVHPAEAASEEVISEEEVVQPDGSKQTVKISAYETKLTSAFEPLVLGQSLGAFANPIEKKVFTLNTKLGAAAQELLVRDGYSLTSDTTAQPLTAKQLEGVTEIGVEVELEAKGEATSIITWKGKANFFYPAYSSLEDKPDGLQAATVDLLGGISVKLAKWASLDYSLGAKYVPMVVDEWQIQHGLLLTAGFNLL